MDHGTDMAIDLHMHSVNSDGTRTTQELIDSLSERGVGIFSFTDHDSVGCYEDLLDGRARLREGMTLVPGVELSCCVDGCLRDMLGYGVSIGKMSEFLEGRYSKERRMAKQQRILDELMVNCRRLGLTFDDSLRVSEGKKAEGFLVMYRELNRHPENVERYPFIADNTSFYWEHFSNRNSDFFVDETFDLPSFADAVSVIHDAGGKAFLAHPYAYGMPQDGVEALVREAVGAGVNGIELRHSSNKGDDVERVAEFARRYGLLTSGGSDFHGSTKPGLELVTGYGNMLVRYEDIAPWIDDVRQVRGGSHDDIAALWT